MLIWFCWTLIHASHFYWSSRFEAFGPLLHFQQKALLHVLHLTGAVLKCKATEHLAHFSLELLASIRDMPWNRGEFNDGGVGRAWEMCCWLNEDSPAVGEKWRWQCQILIERICGFSDPLEIVKPLHVARRRQTLSKNVFFYFYFIRVFFFTTPTSHRAAGEERRPFFCSILPLPPAHKHSDIYLELCMWDDYDYHMFLIAALAFTRLLLYEIYHLIKLPLIDLWCKVSFCLFTWWFGTTFLLQ